MIIRIGSLKPKTNPVGPEKKSFADSNRVPLAAMFIIVFFKILYSPPASLSVFLNSASSATVNPLYSVIITVLDFENLSDISVNCLTFFSFVIRLFSPFFIF